MIRKKLNIGTDCSKILKQIPPIPCNDWNDFRNKVNEMTRNGGRQLEDRQWIFRGALKRHTLKTTLERACGYWGFSLEDLPGIESELIREIKRKAFGFGIPLPPKDDTMWWVSLMQHYGAPTRLLDFTYSPYIAAYFAFEKLLFDCDKKESAVIWAIQHKWTQRGGMLATNNNRTLLKKIRDSELGSLDFLFELRKKHLPSVMQVATWYLHDRITAQQGVFLCPTDITVTFMANFTCVKGWDDEESVKRLILPRSIMPKAFEELQKMNITKHSLFPGFGGLAQSLNYRLPLFYDVSKFRKRQ